MESEELCLKNLKYLVIDEADRMIELGHFREVDQILDRVFSVKKETFDKELEEGVADQTDNPNLYVKDKRIDLSSVLEQLETDKLIELPSDFLKVIDANELGKKKKKKK